MYLIVKQYIKDGKIDFDAILKDNDRESKRKED